jgi:hypothetical protein
MSEEAIEQAEAAVVAARKRLNEIDAQIRQEVEKATSQIKTLFAAELQVAFLAVQGCERNLTAAKDRLPDHPWTGKRVFRMKSVGRFWERRPPVRIEGIVETMRSTTTLPGNTASYSRPALGAGFARLLKKDGTPGLQFESFGRNDGWKLVDEAAIADTSHAPLGPGMNK